MSSPKTRLYIFLAAGVLAVIFLYPSQPRSPTGYLAGEDAWQAKIEQNQRRVKKSIQQLNISDVGLLRCVEKEAHMRSRIPPSNRNSINDAADIPRLSCSAYRIVDLSGIDNITALSSLDISRNQLTDLTPLLGLPNLEKLDISYNPITDLSAVWKLPRLRTLTLPNMPDTPCADIVKRASGLISNASSILCDKGEDATANASSSWSFDVQKTLQQHKQLREEREAEKGIREYERGLRSY